MWVIYGSYRGKKEEIDTAETESSAWYLVQEYSMAYGPDWTVWCEEK